MIHHFSVGQPVDLKGLPGKSRTLFKQDGLQLLWLCLESGKQVDPHQLSCWVQIQCIRGSFEIDLIDQTLQLTEGSLVVLEPSQPHAVFCLQKGAMLIAIYDNQQI